MLLRLSNRIHTAAKGRNVLLLAIATLSFIVLTLPIAQAASAGLSGLDARGFYSLPEAHAHIAALDPDNVADLRAFYLGIDLVIPLLYAFSLALLISWILAQGNLFKTRLKLLNLLPLAAIPFDWLENFSILSLYAALPDQPDSLARMAMLGSRGKFTFVAASIFTVSTALIVFIRERSAELESR
jgi:hypothetical protein